MIAHIVSLSIMIIIILHFASPLKIEKKSAKKNAHSCLFCYCITTSSIEFFCPSFFSSTYNLLEEEKGEAF